MNTGYILVGVTAIVIGLAFAAVAWTHIAPYRDDMRNAEPVDAVVVESEVVESRNAEGQLTHHPEVTYRYTYEGDEYTGHSVFAGDVNPVSDESRARDIVERYPPDAAVTAYVNTEEPTSAFLIERSEPLWFWAGPVVGVLMMLYGIYSIVLGIRDVEPSVAGA